MTTDQRGEPLDKAGPDIGAFQSQGFVLTPKAGTTPQTTSPGSDFANQLAVTVTAKNPVEPVDGGWVNFSAPSSGASAVLQGGSVWAIVKNGSIEYAGVNVTANCTAGTYDVTASTPGASPVNFQLSNVITLTFSGLSSPSIKYGSSATFAGKLSNGSKAPGSNESVVVTVGGISQKAAIGAGGAFSVTINTASLAVSGSPYSVTYSYTTDGSFASASGKGTLTITKGTPTIALTSSGGSAVYLQPVTFVATVTAAGGTPTGTVTFSAGGKTLGTVTLDSSGKATLKTTGLVLGSSSVTATYNGSTNLATATSASVPESVGKASSQIVLVPQPVRKGKKVVAVGLEADVKPVAPATGTLTGTVTFETMKKKKVKILGTATLSGGKATLTLNAKSVLKKAITIVYSGNADALMSTITAPG